MSARETTDALEERKRLQGEWRAAQSAADLHDANAGRMQARSRVLERERIEAYSESARGREGAAERVEAIEEELAEGQTRLEREKAAAEGANRGRRHAEDELARLLKDHLDVFLEEAEFLTEQAREALAELAEPYRMAEQAWSAAAAKYAPLAQAIAREMKELREADGVYSAGRGDSEASRVPAGRVWLGFRTLRGGGAIGPTSCRPAQRLTKTTRPRRAKARRVGA